MLREFRVNEILGFGAWVFGELRFGGRVVQGWSFQKPTK